MAFYVLDAENNTIWAGKEHDDAPMVFKNFAAAEKRAKEFAKSEPGKDIQIVETVATVRCAVAKPETMRSQR